MIRVGRYTECWDVLCMMINKLTGSFLCQQCMVSLFLLTHMSLMSICVVMYITDAVLLVLGAVFLCPCLDFQTWTATKSVQCAALKALLLYSMHQVLLCQSFGQLGCEGPVGLTAIEHLQ